MGRRKCDCCHCLWLSSEEEKKKMAADALAQQRRELRDPKWWALRIIAIVTAPLFFFIFGSMTIGAAKAPLFGFVLGIISFLVPIWLIIWGTKPWWF